MVAFDPSFWRDRRVLVTGHTGFKGAWLVLWLTGLGARVTGCNAAVVALLFNALGRDGLATPTPEALVSCVVRHDGTFHLQIELRNIPGM